MDSVGWGWRRRKWREVEDSLKGGIGLWEVDGRRWLRVLLIDMEVRLEGYGDG